MINRFVLIRWSAADSTFRCTEMGYAVVYFPSSQHGADMVMFMGRKLSSLPRASLTRRAGFGEPRANLSRPAIGVCHNSASTSCYGSQC